MPRRRLIFQAVVGLCLACVITTGCAATQKITDDIMGARPSLEKKIAILPVTTSGPGNNDLHELLPAVMANFLERKCERLFIVGTPGLDEALTAAIRTDEADLDKLALAEVGRRHGLSAVIEPQIDGLQLFTEKRGIWGFRDLHTFLRIALRIRVYDVETTAVLLDKVVRDETALPQTMVQDGLEPNQVDEKFTRTLLFTVAAKAAEQICTSLTQTPWKGYIVEADDGIFRISAGRDVGLKVGDRLEVFAMAEPIQGVDEQIYLIPGRKIGEIKVERVYKLYSEAVKLSGDNLENSACLKLK